MYLFQVSTGPPGHDPLPDCWACGFDYREWKWFRWDVPVYLLSIFDLVSFLLVLTSHRSFVSGTLSSDVPRVDRDDTEKLQAVSCPPRFTFRIMM
jgi:hypothetical protein